MTTPSLAPLTRRAAVAALAAGVMALTGCASLLSTPEQTVSARAEARWAALIAEDFDTAWTFTQPGYRAVVKQRDYGKRFGGGAEWAAAKVERVTCQPERCSVRLHLSVKVLTPPFRNHVISSYITEDWVREDGQWWYRQPL